MTRKLLAAITITAALALTACANNFGAALAYGYQTQTAIQDATTASLQAGDVSRDEAIAVAAIAECINGVLDSAARVWEAGQAAEAQTQLAVALTLLAELQTYDGETWSNERCSP